MRTPTRLVAGLAGLVVALVVAGAVTHTGEAMEARGGASAQQARSACVATGASHPVRRPQFVRRIATGETGWFSSPGLADLNGDGRLEIVAPFYSTFVFDA
jgi:hypothetical protein